MCDRDTIQFLVFTVRMFTFVGASCGHLRDSTAFLSTLSDAAPGESLIEFTPYCFVCPIGPIIAKHDVVHKTGSIRNILQRSKRRTEIRPSAKYVQKLAKFGRRAVSEKWSTTDRQTDQHHTHAHRNTLLPSLPGEGVAE